MNSKRKPLVIIVLLIAVIGALFFFWKRLWSSPFQYAGTVEATQIDLPSRLPTVIDSIQVEEGETVSKGQTLATLACEEVKIAARLAEENHQRASILKRSGSISKEAFDQSESRHEEAKTKLSWCDIQSPVNGTVMTRFLEPKEWVNPGSKIVSIADLENLWAYFYVPSKVMAQLKVGSPITAIIPELDTQIDGVIVKINQEAEFTPKNVQTQAERTRLVFGVKVSFKNKDSVLKPGMTVESSLGERL